MFSSRYSLHVLHVLYVSTDQSMYNACLRTRVELKEEKTRKGKEARLKPLFAYGTTLYNIKKCSAVHNTYCYIVLDL